MKKFEMFSNDRPAIFSCASKGPCFGDICIDFGKNNLKKVELNCTHYKRLYKDSNFFSEGKLEIIDSKINSEYLSTKEVEVFRIL